MRIITLRSYHAAVIALAIDVDPKWLDNLLSHHEIGAVGRGRQGLSRRISSADAVAIAIVRRLVSELSIPVRRAAELSAELLRNERADLGPGLELSIDRVAVTREVERRLLDASEMAVPARRGRPVKRG